MTDLGSKKFQEEVKKPLEAQGYEVQKALGKGAFGEVFLSTKGSKNYAVKSICKQLVKKRPFLQKYIKQEIEAMNLLKHPNLVIQEKVVESNVFAKAANDYYFMVLEFCDQGNLLTHQAKLKTKCFALKEALEILVQVMQGLRVIHEKNYIHRDIKSQNVLIKSTERGRIFKIADFGFARPVKSGTASTICGTQKYMAPEILKNLPYTRSVDIWALGILFFFMLFADYPFKGHDLLFDIQKKCLNGFKLKDAVKVDKLKDVTPELEDFFLHIFVVDSRKRMTFSNMATHPLFTRNAMDFEQHRKQYQQIEKQQQIQHPPNNDKQNEEDECYRAEDMAGQIITSRNKQIAKEVETVSFEMAKIQYLRECANDFYTNPAMMLPVEDRVAIRYYVLRAFVFYARSLLTTLELKKMPKSFQGYKLSEWRVFSTSDDYSNLLDKFRQELMKGQLEFEDSFSQAVDLASRIKIKYFKDKLTPTVEDSDFESFKLCYRSVTSYVFKKVHENRDLDSHLRNKIKLRLFCCHMVNRIFDQNELELNFEYYTRWLKGSTEAPSQSKFDFRNFKKWVACQSKQNLDRNIVLLHKIFFSK